MPVVLLQAVQRSADGSNSVKVVSRWPYQAADLDAAKAFLDATPAFSGWSDIDAYEGRTTEGKLLAKRRKAGAAEWVDADAE